jgi:hypothetical protein
LTPLHRRLAALLLVMAPGCSPARPATDTARLEVGWIGSDTGRLAAPATAEWCDSLRVLEIRAVRGDTGLALALYPRDSVTSDSYPVRLPRQADSARPAAAVAVRWFAETAIQGFRGENGSVVLDTGTKVSGRFEANVSSVNDGDKLKLRGTFRELRVARAGRGCVARRADSARSGID